MTSNLSGALAKIGGAVARCDALGRTLFIETNRTDDWLVYFGAECSAQSIYLDFLFPRFSVSNEPAGFDGKH